MKRFVLIPDSFKGTMSSMEVCSIMAEQIHRRYPDANILSLPVADGGEGSVDAYLRTMGGEKKIVSVQGPYGCDIPSFYGIIGHDTAVIEMAACAGLPLAGKDLRPMDTTTFGVGQLMLNAVECGSRHLILGLGGSCTNDGGAGAAAALGIRFISESGEFFIPTGGTLKDIAHIDISGLNPLIRSASIEAICDVDNPLTGVNGAAYVFGPQKGANEEVVRLLDAGLCNLSSIVRKDLGFEIDTVPGSGSAGGMGAGMMAFFGAKLRPGIEVMLDAVQFDEAIAYADMVFTGEGKLDEQSLRGKVISGVARHTKKLGVPLVAIVGDIGDNIDGIYELGVNAVFSINRVAADFSIVRSRCRKDLAQAMDNLMRFMLSCT